MMDPKLIGICAAIGSAASWAAGSILFKKIGENVSPFGMTLFKGIFGVILLGAVLLILGFDPIETDSLILLCLSGLLGISIADTLFFAALQDLGPMVLVVLFMIGQILTAIMAIFFLDEVPSITEWIGIGLTLLGISWVLWVKLSSDAANTRSTARGVIFGLFSIGCMSCATIIAKPALSSVSTLTATFARMAAGTLGVLILGILTRRLNQWSVPVRDIAILSRFIAAVCIITFGGFWLSLVSIKYVDVAVASTLSATEPLLIIPLAILILKEKVSVPQIAGTLIATSGVFLLMI